MSVPSTPSGSDFVIEHCRFEDVLPSWQNELWPGRKSPIEPISCLDDRAQVDMSILALAERYAPIYWRLRRVSDSKVVGTISLHRTRRTVGRMRGMWVDESLRGQGQGRALVLALLSEARRQKLHSVWILGRKGNAVFYEKLGFKAELELPESGALEFGPHSLSRIKIRPSFSIFSIFSRF